MTRARLPGPGPRTARAAQARRLISAARLAGRVGVRGFTLVEVLVSAALLAMVFIALVAAFGHEVRVTQRGEDITRATFLANEIRDMALGKRTFQEVLDLHGGRHNPAVLSTGTSLDLARWTQKVEVDPVDAVDLETPDESADPRAARVTVTVLLGDEPVLTQSFYIFDMDGVPFVPGGG